MWEKPPEHHCEVCDRPKDPTEIQIRSTEPSNETTNTFYLCPHLLCEGREDDIREMKQWELKTDPAREFSEEKLENIVEEMVEQDRGDHQIISDAVDDVRSRLIDDSSEISLKEIVPEQ